MRLSKTATALLAGVLILLLFPSQCVLAKRGVRLVCDIWPPYQTETQNGYSGLAVDVVRKVYARLGVEDVEIMALPWKRALDMIRFGDADGLFSANYTPERAVYLYYPEEPLFESPWVVWTRKGLTVQNLDDLKGLKIGVVLGYTYTPEFWKFIQVYCTVEEVHSDEINFRKLALGRLDATVAEYGNGRLLSQIVRGGVQPNDVQIKKDGLYIVFSREHTTQRAVRAFSGELKAFKQTQAYRDLRKKYLSSDR
ncbi:transporter substrate-binding domain-containing protein [Desulfovibrio sp. Huiquan2017]|uniref:substrate-binding periplasmic protein n=1 Tax=Desulfovibrio sp. Huiquan2017 TaxID=2816861 RepID=UPI001A915469|nr:transporter substrate-binding domain-containing protein [Desulfovibrio sp. Huiquan2017]